jgi:hypothetical protein
MSYRLLRNFLSVDLEIVLNVTKFGQGVYSILKISRWPPSANSVYPFAVSANSLF